MLLLLTFLISILKQFLQNKNFLVSQLNLISHLSEYSILKYTEECATDLTFRFVTITVLIQGEISTQKYIELVADSDF